MADASSVSVIIPAYNAAGTIEAALASVRGQTYPVAEVIVIDDASTDDTRALVGRQGHGIRLACQKNAGPAAARNHGLALAGGDMVAFLDADDLWPAGRLEALAGVLAREPELGVALGHTRDLWEWPGAAPRFGTPYLSFIVGSALFRRSVFERVGGFDPALRDGEDVEFWVRVGEQDVRRRAVREVTLYYRRKLVDSIDGMRRHQANLMRALKRSLERRRRAEQVKAGGEV